VIRVVRRKGLTCRITSDCSEMNATKRSLFWPTLGVLVIISVLADVALLLLHIQYLAARGYSFWDSVPIKEWLGILLTPTGAVLATLGFSPFLYALVYFSVERRRSKRDLHKWISEREIGA
jgi:hypothetical protein